MRARPLIPVLFTAAALAFGACGDDDEGSDAPTATTDVESYCELSRELDEAGREQFEALERDPEASEEDFAQVEAEFVRSNEEALEEIAEVAPAEIADEVEILVATVRARGGLEGDPPDEDAAREAEEAIQRFERENCQAPGG